jgi:hypothetical protein
MRRRNQNQEKRLSHSVFKRVCGNRLRCVLCEVGRNAQRCHTEFSQLFFVFKPLSETSRSLSGKNPGEITGMLAGKSQAGIAELVDGRLERPARARWFSEASDENIEVYNTRRFKRQGSSWTGSRGEHLAQVLWWHTTALAKTKVNLGWPPCAPPINSQLTKATQVFCPVVVP